MFDTLIKPVLSLKSQWQEYGEGSSEGKTVGGVRKPLSIRANLWLDGSDAHSEGAGSAQVEE